MSKPKPIRVCIVINPALALSMLRREWGYYMNHGCELWGVSGPGPEHHDTVNRMGMATHVVPMERYPHPVKDLVSLARLWWFLLWHRFDVIQVSTPKASFLGMLGARASGHRQVVYLVRGRAYENMTGWRRSLISVCEWINCQLAALVVPICRELGQVLVNEGLCPARKIHFTGSGSDRGVDTRCFSPTEENLRAGREIRKQLGISDQDRVVLCVGWLRKEKGTNELVPAFCALAERHSGLHLLLLGSYEPSDPLEPEVVATIENHERIHHLPWCAHPAPVFAAADILAFPSHREGFGNVAIEASAMELPVVASDIMGCREAVLHGVTGLLVPVGDVKALEAALRQLIEDPALRHRLAANGRRRVVNEFRQEIIFEGMRQLFCRLASCPSRQAGEPTPGTERARGSPE